MDAASSGTAARLNHCPAEGSAMPLRDVDYVTRKLHWMHGERIWPNGLRYLWTDAFGLALYVSLFRVTGAAEIAGRVDPQPFERGQ